MSGDNYGIQGNIDISQFDSPEYIKQWEYSVEVEIAIALYKQILQHNSPVVVVLEKRWYREPAWIQNIAIKFDLTNVQTRNIFMPKIESIQLEPTGYLFSEVTSELKRRIKSKFRRVFK